MMGEQIIITLTFLLILAVHISGFTVFAYFDPAIVYLKEIEGAPPDPSHYHIHPWKKKEKMIKLYLCVRLLYSS